MAKVCAGAFTCERDGCNNLTFKSMRQLLQHTQKFHGVPKVYKAMSEDAKADYVIAKHTAMTELEADHVGSHATDNRYYRCIVCGKDLAKYKALVHFRDVQLHPRLNGCEHLVKTWHVVKDCNRIKNGYNSILVLATSDLTSSAAAASQPQGVPAPAAPATQPLRDATLCIGAVMRERIDKHAGDQQQSVGASLSSGSKQQFSHLLPWASAAVEQPISQPAELTRESVVVPRQPLRSKQKHVCTTSIIPATPPLEGARERCDKRVVHKGKQRKSAVAYQPSVISPSIGNDAMRHATPSLRHDAPMSNKAQSISNAASLESNKMMEQVRTVQSQDTKLADKMCEVDVPMPSSMSIRSDVMEAGVMPPFKKGARDTDLDDFKKYIAIDVPNENTRNNYMRAVEKFWGAIEVVYDSPGLYTDIALKCGCLVHAHRASFIAEIFGLPAISKSLEIVIRAMVKYIAFLFDHCTRNGWDRTCQILTMMLRCDFRYNAKGTRRARVEETAGRKGDKLRRMRAMHCVDVHKDIVKMAMTDVIVLALIVDGNCKTTKWFDVEWAFAVSLCAILVFNVPGGRHGEYGFLTIADMKAAMEYEGEDVFRYITCVARTNQHMGATGKYLPDGSADAVDLYLKSTKKSDTDLFLSCGKGSQTGTVHMKSILRSVSKLYVPAGRERLVASIMRMKLESEVCVDPQSYNAKLMVQIFHNHSSRVQAVYYNKEKAKATAMAEKTQCDAYSGGAQVMPTLTPADIEASLLRLTNFHARGKHAIRGDPCSSEVVPTAAPCSSEVVVDAQGDDGVAVDEHSDDATDEVSVEHGGVDDTRARQGCHDEGVSDGNAELADEVRHINTAIRNCGSNHTWKSGEAGQAIANDLVNSSEDEAADHVAPVLECKFQFVDGNFVNTDSTAVTYVHADHVDTTKQTTLQFGSDASAPP